MLSLELPNRTIAIHGDDKQISESSRGLEIAEMSQM